MPEDIKPGGKWPQLRGPVRLIRMLGGLVLLILGFMGMGAAIRVLVSGAGSPASWQMLGMHFLLAGLGVFLLWANRRKG